MLKNYFVLFFLFFSNLLYSKNIEITGLNKLSIDDLNAISSIDINSKNISDDNLNTLINELYQSDLIYNVEVNYFENHIQLIISESKIINKVFINGNQFIKDEVIFNLISSQNEKLLSKNNIIADESLIRQIYLSEGYNDISISSSVEFYSENRINLIFDIQEGYQSNISKIDFVGNKYLSAKYLKSFIRSNEKNLLSFLSSGGSRLDFNLINFDKNKIIELYRDKGFFDVKVSSQINKNFTGFYNLDFYINEGDRLKIKDLDYDIDESFIKNDFLKIKERFESNINKNNYFFDKTIIQEFVDELNNLSMKFNQPEIEFEALLVNNDTLRIFDKRSKLLVANQIIISGNSITKDDVIRSRFEIEPGDYIKKYYVDKSKSNLDRLKFINTSNFTIKNISQDKSDIYVDIDEIKETGSISLAGFLSADVGLGVSFGINDTNFLGSGNEINASVSLSEEDLEFQTSYSVISASNSKMKHNYQLSNLEKDLTPSFGYKVEERNIGYTNSFEIDDKTNLIFGVSYKSSDGSSPAINNNFVTENIGSFQDTIISLSINYNNLDNFYYPTDGISSNLSLNVSPTLISDNSFYKLVFNSKFLKKSKNNNNFYFLNSKFGIADSLNQENLKTLNTFSLGGTNFQGFDYRGIGTFINGKYLGGNKFFTLTTGRGGNFIFDNSDNIYFKTFATIGSVWDSDYTDQNKFNLRSSIGISMDFITASIPITFIYAIPISKQNSDKVRQFNFSIGTSF